MKYSLALALALALSSAAALAQAPAWDLALRASGAGAIAAAAATDAAGNVFVTGYFTSTATFGPTQLRSAGSYDVFVAKWDATAQAYTWAASGGGTVDDRGLGIAVRGSNVYVTGFYSGGINVRIAGQALAGTGSISNVFVAKYVDTSTGHTPATSSFANGWATSGGGASNGEGRGIAVAANGTGVYVTGRIGSGSNTAIAGQALPGAGNFDAFVAKFLDTGPTTFANGWATSGGGGAADEGQGIAVEGTNIYITGFFSPSPSPSFAGQLLTSAGGQDVFVAKYVDTSTGSTQSVANGWATSGGGTAADVGYAVAVNGPNVYVTGTFGSGSGTLLAGQALTGAGALDVFVAKYVDTSTGSTPATSSFSNGWATSGGGTNADFGFALAVNGPNVYVAGSFASGTGASFAGQVLPGAGNTDLFVAKYTDTSTGSPSAPGSFANGWATSGGGTSGERGYGLALSSAGLYVSGEAGSTSSTFGSLVVGSGALLARLPVVVLGSRGPASGPGSTPLTLYPNPAHAALTVAGAPAGTAVQVLDALGRPVAQATADAVGTARLVLPAGLAAGFYVLRSGGRAQRLTVE